MEIWIASANPREITEAKVFPVVGTITNPTLLANEGRAWRQTVRNLSTAGSGPIHIQTTAATETSVIEQAGVFRSLVGQRSLVLKMPIAAHTLAVMPELKDTGYSTNLTAICSLSQAVLAAGFHADYVSVYVARLLDDGIDGFGLLRDIRNYFEQQGVKTKVIAASIRTVEQFSEAAKAGAHGVAAPVQLLRELLAAPLTVNSIAAFTRDWEKVSEEE